MTGNLSQLLRLAQGLADGVVYDMVEDKEGVLWIGTNLGYSGLSFESTKYEVRSTNVTNDEVRSKNDEIRTSSFVLRTSIGAGLMNVSNEELENYTPVWEIYNNNTGYPIKDLNTNAMCITKIGLPYGTEEDIGVIWGGCGDDKVIRFDPKAVHKYYEPPTVVIQSIKINSENICWYTAHPPKDRPPSDGSAGTGVVPSDGSAGGSAGTGVVPSDGSEGWEIDSLTLAQQEIMTYGKVLSEAERDTMRQQFAGIEFDGITRFYPLPQNLVLPYKHNHITIEFNAIETGRHFLVNYQYMLEGQDEKWSPITKKTDVTYGNLYEGEYTFLLKAQSPWGVWSEPVHYSFMVLPPWYRTWWAYAIYGCMAIMVIWFIVWANSRRLMRQKKALEQTVEVRTAELNTTNEELSHTNEELSHANEEIAGQRDELETTNTKLKVASSKLEVSFKHITESIDAAQRIQKAILPPEEYITKTLPDHFILYKPRDIVSGDFYWASQIPPKKGGRGVSGSKLIVAACDCTGHGVPGAFLSMLGIAFLNEITSKNTNLQPGEILNQLRTLIIKSLHQTGNIGESKDGMDAAIFIINPANSHPEKEKRGIGEREIGIVATLQFAGAYNPLYLIRNNELIETKADRMPVGIHFGQEKSFTNHQIKIQKGDIIYIFSDGYVDQFGGAKGKKFKFSRFRELFLSIHKKPMEQQKEILNTTIEKWQAHTDPISGENFEQFDDILILGMRF